MSILKSSWWHASFLKTFGYFNLITNKYLKFQLKKIKDLLIILNSAKPQIITDSEQVISYDMLNPINELANTNAVLYTKDELVTVIEKIGSNNINESKLFLEYKLIIRQKQDEFMDKTLELAKKCDDVEMIDSYINSAKSMYCYSLLFNQGCPMNGMLKRLDLIKSELLANLYYDKAILIFSKAKHDLPENFSDYTLLAKEHSMKSETVSNFPLLDRLIKLESAFNSMILEPLEDEYRKLDAYISSVQQYHPDYKEDAENRRSRRSKLRKKIKRGKSLISQAEDLLPKKAA